MLTGDRKRRGQRGARCSCRALGPNRAGKSGGVAWKRVAAQAVLLKNFCLQNEGTLAYKSIADADV